jgi:hypothetical protein
MLPTLIILLFQLLEKLEEFIRHGLRTLFLKHPAQIHLDLSIQIIVLSMLFHFVAYSGHFYLQIYVA